MTTRTKCSVCQRVYYSDVQHCPECGQPTVLNPATNEELPLREDSVKIIKNAARCVKCGDVIESTNCHDFKYCSCRAVAVDGGREYLRRVGNPGDCEDLSITDETPEEVRRFRENVFRANALKDNPSTGGWSKDSKDKE